MNALDIKFKVKLNNAKCKINSIEELSSATSVILNDAKSDGAERYRFWYKKLKNMHPLIDAYLAGQINSSEISDVTAEHIVNTQPDTQNVDLKYYYDTVSMGGGTSQTNAIQPLPIRNSIRNKLSADQLKMTEDAYMKLNKNYAIIMSTFFESKDPSGWVVNRIAAHSHYNTQDYYGFSVKVLLYDIQMQTVLSKYKDKINLIDSIIPIKESIIVDYDPFLITIEGKKMVIDPLGNKIVNLPKTVSNSPLEAQPLI